MCGGKERRPFPFGEGPQSAPQAEEGARRGSGIISLDLASLQRTLTLPVGASAWGDAGSGWQELRWGASRQLPNPAVWGLPEDRKWEGQLLLGLVGMHGAQVSWALQVPYF